MEDRDERIFCQIKKKWIKGFAFLQSPMQGEINSCDKSWLMASCLLLLSDLFWKMFENISSIIFRLKDWEKIDGKSKSKSEVDCFLDELKLLRPPDEKWGNPLGGFCYT